MNTARQIPHNLIEEIPKNELAEIIDFIEYLKLKKEKQLYKDLTSVSESSLKFWENDIDDEVWRSVL